MLMMLIVFFYLIYPYIVRRENPLYDYFITLLRFIICATSALKLTTVPCDSGIKCESILNYVYRYIF